jgi:hypothetical protein
MKKSISEQLQDELEPIIHPTQYDESDAIEATKKTGGMTPFEKSEYERKLAEYNFTKPEIIATSVLVLLFLVFLSFLFYLEINKY